MKKLLALSLCLAVCLLSGCKKNKLSGSSLTASASSHTTSSESVSSAKSEKTVSSESQCVSLRPTFLQSDSDGNIFYCAASGGVYKQLFQSNKLSKIYGSNGYDFSSVEALDGSLICVGYSKSGTSGYTIFNLKDKTASNAVDDPDFESISIYSLMHVGDAIYFLSTPDRYNRYTLYKRQNSKTEKIASGVNEYSVYGDRIFFNIGRNIFSADADGENVKLFCEVKTNDLMGFVIVNGTVVCMSSAETFYIRNGTGAHVKLPYRLNVYTCAGSGNDVFFCGTNGGIYHLSASSFDIRKVSEYTCSQLSFDGENLYLFPAQAKNYPSVLSGNIINGGIYRFSIHELLGRDVPESVLSQPGSDTKTSSSAVSSNSFDNTQSSESDDIILRPELFGK